MHDRQDIIHEGAKVGEVDTAYDQNHEKEEPNDITFRHDAEADIIPHGADTQDNAEQKKGKSGDSEKFQRIIEACNSENSH